MNLGELLQRVDVVSPPSEGLWRVARASDPLRSSRLDESAVGTATLGNRWDGTDFGVLYCGTDLESCFGEVLARYRPKPELAELVRSDWEAANWMSPSQLPRDWAARRVAVRVTMPSYIFLDVESVKTRTFLAEQLVMGLSALGLTSLDVPDIRSRDRRITRLISRWVNEFVVEHNDISGPPFAGIRYESRINTDWECWAIYDDVEVKQEALLPVEQSMPPLQTILNLYGLTLH